VESEKVFRRDRQGTLALSGFLGSAVVAIVLVGGSYWMSVRARQAQDWVAHTHEVRTAIAQMRADIVDIQNGQRGFVLTGDPAELQPYEAARRSIGHDLEHVRELTRDSPEQQAALRELDGHLSARLAVAASVVEVRRTRGFDAAKAIIDQGVGRSEMAAVRLLLQRMEAESSRLLAQRLAEHEQRVRAFTAGAAVLLLATLAALVFLYQQIQRKRLVDLMMILV
jgi:CHASE3 domain sensor protein